MASEFDDYAAEYSSLLRDPIRDQFASDPAFFTWRKLDLLRDFYRRWGRDTTTLRWIDVGCGQGELLRLGRSQFAAASGCDPSLRMLDACRDLDVRHQSAVDRIPFPDQQFDLATAVCIYHHVERPWRLPLAREAVRVLKSGGLFCIVEHNPRNPITRMIVRRTPVDAHAQLLSAIEAERLMRSAGMRVLETRHFLFVPQRLYRKFAGVEGLLAGLPFGGQYAVFGQKV